MMRYVRKIWFRLLVVVLIVAFLDSVALGSDLVPHVRGVLLAALPSTTILFALTAGLAMAMTSNSVFGTQEKLQQQVRLARDIIAKLNENVVARSESSAVRELFAHHIEPLLALSMEEWRDPDNFKDWAHNIDESLAALDPRSRLVIATQYLIPLEDEMNLLGILCIRSMLVPLHLDVLRGTFMFIIYAVVVMAAGHLVPTVPPLDLAVVSLAASVVVYAVLELLLVLSYVEQQARGERGA